MANTRSAEIILFLFAPCIHKLMDPAFSQLDISQDTRIYMDCYYGHEFRDCTGLGNYTCTLRDLPRLLHNYCHFQLIL